MCERRPINLKLILKSASQLFCDPRLIRGQKSYPPYRPWNANQIILSARPWKSFWLPDLMEVIEDQDAVGGVRYDVERHFKPTIDIAAFRARAVI